MEKVKILKGDIAFSLSPKEIRTCPESFIVLREGIVENVYEEIPEKYQGIQFTDFGRQLIIPGFTDLHIHAPQFYQRGLGMDMELIHWLETYTFHQEEKFKDLDYAQKAYTLFVDAIVRQGTLSACIFATVHTRATKILFELLNQKKIHAFVGKVNMDQNCPEGLSENTKKSLKETEKLIQKYQKSSPVKPIITPRFVPTCSDKLLQGLGELAQSYHIPVQSHLSENKNEVAWVKELHPDLPNYASVYDQYGLFGQTPTLMAHCIHNTEDEIEMMAEKGVIAVYCPISNLNLSSGIMPVRKLLKKGVKVGLGSDVGGGHQMSMNQVIVCAIQQSKIKSTLGPENEALSFEEAFYMATKGGGKFFGKVGSFEKGYRFAANVIDDSSLGEDSLSLRERLQRFIYIGDDRNISARFVNGVEIK